MGVNKTWTKNKTAGRTQWYEGIRLNGNYWVRLVIERRKRKCEKSELGYDFFFPENELVLAPLTSTTLSIPWPQSDDVYVMVPDNFDALTAPPSSLKDGTSSPSLHYQFTANTLHLPKFKTEEAFFEWLASVPQDGTYNGEILEALDILDDFIVKEEWRRKDEVTPRRTEQKSRHTDGFGEASEWRTMWNRRLDHRS